ncbi:hypothetical protein [Nostoc sp.]
MFVELPISTLPPTLSASQEGSKSVAGGWSYEELWLIAQTS